MAGAMQYETPIARFGGGKPVTINLTVPQRIRQALAEAARLGFTEQEIMSLTTLNITHVSIDVSLLALRRVFSGQEAEVTQTTGGYRHYAIVIPQDDIEFDAMEPIESPTPGKAVL